MTDPRFHRRCRELGQEVFERAAAAQPRIWQKSWWQEQATRYLDRDERLKVQLFRFIDVLPVLRSDAEVVRHLREYLDPGKADLPLALRFALAPKDPRSLAGWKPPRAHPPAAEPARIRAELPWRARVAAKLARAVAPQMAKRFIAGSNADEALNTIVALRGRKMAFTLDVLGEATVSDAEADQHQQVYLDVLNSMHRAALGWLAVPQIDFTSVGPQPRVNVSVKFSALQAQVGGLDPARFAADVKRRMRPILRRARELGAFINVDMESYALRDLTLAVFKELLLEDEFCDWPNVGTVVQAYLLDGEADLRGLLEWVDRRGAPIGIRLVKGAYWDYETTIALQKGSAPPVWTRKWESDANYEKLAETVLRAVGRIRPAFASHNVRSLAAVMATAEDLGLTPGDYEIQMLYGMGDPLKTAIAGMGRCLRVYAPYGDLLPGMAYLIRRLLENTSNDSFLKQSFADRASQDRLLADPATAQPASAPLPQRRYQDTDEEAPMIELTHVPDTDFSKPQARETMQAAIKYVRGELGQEHALVIAGKPVYTGRWDAARNPARPDEVIGKLALADAGEFDTALTAARQAWPDWRRVGAAERARCLRTAARALSDRRFEFAALIILEGGQPWRDADGEVCRTIDLLNYYAAQAESLERRPRRRDLPGESNHTVYDALGVAAVLAPGDFALYGPGGTIAAALVAGNAVVFSPSPTRGVTAAKLVTLLVGAGVPPGALAFAPTDDDRAREHLCRHAGVAAVAVQYAAALDDPAERESLEKLHAACFAAPLTDAAWPSRTRRLIVECGGNNPIVVDDDADLDQAVIGVIESAFAASGQRSDACGRVIVVAGVYEAFCKRLTEAARGVVVGPAEDPATLLVGPLVSATARDRVRRHIELGKRECRELFELDVRALGDQGYYVGPTVLADVAPRSRLACRRMSGPVLAVMPAADFESAVELANDAPNALTGGLYSRSPAHVEWAVRELRVGNLFINRRITGARVDVQPFGGLGPAGLAAKAGGPDYLLNFVEPRGVTENTLRHGLASVEDVQVSAH